MLDGSFRAHDRDNDRENFTQKATAEQAKVTSEDVSHESGPHAAAESISTLTTTSALGKAWDQIEASLLEELGDSKYQRWFGSVKLVEDNGETLVLGVPNLFIQGWIERRYQDLISAVCRRVVGPRRVSLRIDGELYRTFRQAESRFLDQIEDQAQPTSPTESAQLVPLSPEPLLTPSDTEPNLGDDSTAVEVRLPADEPVLDVRRATIDGLKADHTLDRFVVGACNHVAFNAGMDVLRLPGKSYNPLFVYGGSGQGKTHLLQGLTRELFRRGVRSIRYITCEGFVNRFVSALRNRTLEKFRQRFQSLRVLVLDDVHVLQNKPQTQMELLHTIDAIATAGGQVILASDSRPQAIQKLQKQLQGRFVGGLVCRMDPPDYPTRLKILQQEAKNRGVVVPDAVFHLIAKEYYRNVRELIGALVRVVASSSLLDEPLTERSAARILEEHGGGEPAVSLEGISGIAATRHGLQVADLQSRSRARTVSLARQEAIYLARVLTEHSLAELGRFYGGRNHATVNFAYGRVVERIAEDEAYRREMEDLVAQLRGG